MKHYLKALQEYEENNNCFKLLCDFMSLKRSDLIDLYCDGKLNLPSFILLKRLKEKYAELLIIDSELNALFTSAITYSKLFYSKAVTVIRNSSADSAELESLFAKQAQPAGQKLVDLLLHIKSRIRTAKLKCKKEKNISNQMISKRRITSTYTFKLLSHVFYKTNIFLSTNYKFTKILYGIVLLSILWVINTYLMTNILPLYTAFFNITYCLSMVVVLSLICPAWTFGKTDIHGRNVVAYKYRVFFNNISNKKMYYVFAMQNSNITRQNLGQSIDS
ncbi:MAG: hypothetical protein Tsb006_7610 [Rickettsiaceae bacterium]